MNRRQIRDIAAIMDVEPAMIPFLDRLDYPDNMLNPWGEGLRAELARLELSPASRVLDVPCGTGGVAAIVEDVLCGRRVAPGTQIVVPTVMLNLTEACTPDPCRFSPDRWSGPGAAPWSSLAGSMRNPARAYSSR